MSEQDPIAEFRRMVNRAAHESGSKWEDSKRVHESAIFPVISQQLFQASQSAILQPAVKEALRQALNEGRASRMHELDGPGLKTLTGFPPSKAVRALCVYFGLIQGRAARWPVPEMSDEEIDRLLRPATNPFELLRQSPVASVLDLGAGDLSFACDLADQYVPVLQSQGRDLILHAVDRLDPASKLGGPLHPGQERIARLQKQPGLSFHFYGNQDMCDLHELDDAGKLAARYAIVTCWAPATPTFAYEPTRLSDAVITADLRRTKGAFRHIRYEGESALEVQHGERALIFPSWKFEIRGPLALLNLLARRGVVGILGAVDSQVFWELLAQLLEDPRYRPPDLPFTSSNLPDIFGEVYQRLTGLAIGEALSLADLTSLRTILPLPGRTAAQAEHKPCSFRQVLIRRGAVFPGLPASSTARRFSDMIEESPPWFMTLVPNR
ncbi:MAG TPA: hypothetical protein VES58_08760 [Syntrophobacteria bacterium]|nr:hypothetical protein [Syntrophobacteria bacterium]